jgi:electron transfer flavoprotein-quinone oxidoreductase
MASVKYDVVIVGAGPAGITAAIALAKASVPVLVIECAVFPGAENWSGAVYYTENLAKPDVLGEQAVRDSAIERPVTKRGIHIYNGHSLVGLTYHNPDTFRNSYTVLRPTYDHYLAELAKSSGATILTETTVTGLLREDAGKITGVRTDRGPIAADVVFLAEGDASHLVTKEGYERCKGEPHFLQGIAEVIEVAPEEIERRFNLPCGEGAAYELVLRNPGKMRLNMGGFIYTNAASVSLGLVLPLDNLAREFSGDHNRLMEWFKSLPEIRRWVGDGRSVAYGAKLIRGGGLRELPQLVDNGLALGGACTGIGLDFPYPNFTGPATAMGRLFAQAVRQADGDFSRERLTELYEKPLRQTHYFKNIEFLENWPHYVEHTRVFFGRAADLVCGSVYIATHEKLNAGQKLWQLAKFARETLPPKHWKEFIADLREQRAALGLNRVVGAPFRARPADGAVTLDLFVDGERRPLPRFIPAPPAAACDHLYRNDDTPLPIKLHSALRCVKLRRYVALLCISALAALLAPLQWLCEVIKLLVTRPSPEKYLSGFFQKYRSKVRQRANVDDVKIAQPWEEKLATIRYFSEDVSHIKVIRPLHFEDRTKIADSPLWHVCPAKVYEDKLDDLGQVQIIVNYENCIKCESCWRATPADVDWTRQRRHRLIFSAPTEANRKLLELIQSVPVGAALLPQPDTESRQECRSQQKLQQFCDAVYSGPRYIDAGRARWLKSLVADAPPHVRDFAERNKFFWAAAETNSSIQHSASSIEHPALRAELNRLFPKQSIKDLEHGKRLTDEQLAFLKSLKPHSETLAELARKDPSFAVLVSGIYPAQIAARPELGNVPWIGLTAARMHWRDFPSMEPVTLPEVAETFRAIALGAGEMLLERCKQHAISRVQFPGLFKDEDGHDGVAKFGAVKALLSEMEAKLFLLRHLETDAATIKVAASEAFVVLAYNAGQIIGGSAYSEDDIFSKYYRDSVCFSRMLFDDQTLKRSPIRLTIEPASELESEIRKLVVGAASSPQLGAGRGGDAAPTESLGKKIAAHGYIEQPLHNPPVFNYREALQREQHYDHGDFLVKPFDPNEWRYVPEMLHADAELHAYHEQLYRYFIEKFWNARFDGQPYYRFVEKLHMIPLEHVREMVARGFMRMYIPKEFGGEGLLKAHYYILCPLSMRYADPSYALTIMAHSSIGTTPILLALNQDLPRAKTDLQGFLADQSKIQNLKSKIQNILRMLDSPEALKVKKIFTALGETVKNEIGRKPMLRALASDFLSHFMNAGRAGLRSDISNFKSELLKAQHALDSIRPRAEAMIAELDRRAEAAKFFLRLISAGQISAFALTEPSAGSDSGGIQTRAELKRVEVFTDETGKYFMLGKERRRIVDAATVDVTNLPDCDIAQIRRENSREFYEYYELNGAKMWITNGHVAGVFCLYARTPEGPTGFMVLRNSEGLVVGKDEEKMGQRGSPTNELSLNGVRVPRESIIGIEGRGQVNALETLNVGRTGLCVTATAMIAKIVEQTRPFVREPWQQQLLGEMAMELYACESLAYELIGRFDHHGTKDARTESAIGKYYASEALHRVIAAAEKIIGIEAVTQLHELEKHRRDARVLNIYEGTNEVQRFLILRDLVDTVLPKAKIETELMRDLKAAVDIFGTQVWQNPGLQPTMFKLAEMAGYYKLLDSIRWRTEWLRNNTVDADAQRRTIAEELAARYEDFVRAEIQRLHTEFERDFGLLRQGFYPPEVRIAMLALQEEEEKKPKLQREVDLPLASHIVVAMNVLPGISPQARVSNGELLETHFEFDAASRSAMAVATRESLSERRLHASEKRVTAVAVAPKFAAGLLRRALASGATDAALLESEELPVDALATARMVSDYIALKFPACDLVLCGDRILAAALSGNLGGKPAVQEIEPGAQERQFTVEEYFVAFGKPLEIVRDLVAEPAVEFSYRLPEAPVVEAKVTATPDAAAALVRKLAGVGGGDGEVVFADMLPASEVPQHDAAVFLAARGRTDGIEPAAAAAKMLGLPFHVVMLGGTGPAALGALQTIWKDTLPPMLAAGEWANELLALFANTFPRVQARFGVLAVEDGKLVLPAFGGKVQRVVSLSRVSEHPLVATFSGGAQLAEKPQRVYHLPLPEETEPSAGKPKSIAEAEFIIDVGYALRNRENFDRIILPLKKRLEEIGVKNVMIGGTRKVVEELKLLGPDQQIGQTGLPVNPKVILSIGISGAPQHVDYIGDRATIIAFNKDADAPLMTLNQRRARPKVVPIVGDLFETVPQFMAALGSQGLA